MLPFENVNSDFKTDFTHTIAKKKKTYRYIHDINATTLTSKFSNHLNYVFTRVNHTHSYCNPKTLRIHPYIS